MRFRRRQLLVDRLQYSLMLQSVMHFAVAALLFVTVLVAPLIAELWEPTLSIQDRAAVASQLLMLHGRLWPAVAAMMVLVSLHALIQSHRIAGPLYRFRQIFRAVTHGDLAVFDRIRRRDHLQDHAAELQQMVQSLRIRVHSMKRVQQVVHDQLAFVDSVLESGSTAKAREFLQLVGETNDELGEMLARFRTEHEERGADPAESAPQDEADRATGPGAALRIADEAEDAKRQQHGFSLIELLIVVGLIGTIAAIGLPSYMEALDKARIAKAIGDIDAISLRIDEFYTGQGRGPLSLAEIGYGDYLDPYGNPYRYWSFMDDGKKAKGGGGGNKDGARKDKFFKPLNSDYDVYSMGEDGESNLNLQAKVSKDDIVRAANGGFIGLAEDF